MKIYLLALSKGREYARAASARHRRIIDSITVAFLLT
jgi:hypothetical protein